MREKIKFIILPLICVIIVGITFYMINDIKSRVEDTGFDTENIIDSEEDILVENEIEQEVVSEDVSEEDELPVAPEGKTNDTTDKKEQAIELAKKEWGEDSSVLFRCDTVTPKGEYIIEVITRASTVVKTRFRVNLEQETVEVYY